MDNIFLKRLELGPMANFVYILGDRKNSTCAVVDPGWDSKEILKACEKEELKITHILLTHAHFDHAREALRLSENTGAGIYVGKEEAGEFPKESRTELSDGAIINIGDIRIKCLHTPGHTKGGMCYLFGSAVFTGDTLFVDSIGRTDLPGGNEREMLESLQKLCELPDKTVVYPGHGYGAESASTIGEQKKRNPFLKF